MGIMANKNYYCAKKSIKKPNIIIARSAHPAFNKAAYYLKIELIQAELNPDKSVNV